MLLGISLTAGGMLLARALFEPVLPYRVSARISESVDSPHFVTTLAALTGGHLSRSSNIDVFPNGENYYKAELEAIASAQRTICLEAYIFESGEVTRQFLKAMRERALAGVTVNLLVDAVGSYGFPDAEAHPLRAAGGKFARYLPPRWYTWPRVNNRTHRELLIIDGRVAFVGGAGWGDHWLKPKERAERWRDTMVRVRGDAATGLQAAFAENWLEATGDILTGDGYFPRETDAGRSAAIVVSSSPGMGRSTPARVLFQVLLASARQRIYLTTPYFLPDANIREEIARAIRERGVEVKIITPGPGTDHLLTRHSSRRLYGPLLEAGAHIYEYQPTMMHAKILTIDSQWAVVGSTNIDPRSFSLNDEVNLATPDPQVAQRLEQDFAGDLSRSREITYSEWKQRGITERLHELFGTLIERQQ